MDDRPPVTIELLLGTPPPGEKWCAICAMLYLGEVSENERNRTNIRLLVQSAVEDGIDTVNFIPSTKPWRKLRVAVTSAPTVHFPHVPMPTCWIHMQGMKSEGRPTDIVEVNINGSKRVPPRGNT